MMNEQMMHEFPKKWWQKQVVYQVYPRSFCDTNGDGIGDLKGITAKLDYLAYLGIKMIWLNPVYQSPNDDNGYDVSDFYDIMDEFGTMSDYDELLDEAHKRGIKIVMDLVLNHTSDEHAWFIEAKQSKDNPKRDYYIWADPKADGSAPTNWGSFFGTSCWTYSEETNQYYMHIFSTKMPDLNWDNDEMRKSLFEAINYWLDKGIDGFRVDAIPHIKRNKNWQDAPNPDNKPFVIADHGNYANLPGVHEFVQETAANTFLQSDVFTVGEAASANVAEGLRYTDPTRGELNAIIHFHHSGIDADNDTDPRIGGKWMKKNPDFMEMQGIMKEWTEGLYGKGWTTLFLNNHDMPRMVGRFGDISTSEFRIKSAKMLATMMYLQWGMPFMLQGEEIGMTSPQFKDVSSYRDTEVSHYYQQFLDFGKTQEEAMQLLATGSRDGSRTPMQWSSDANGGFTTGTPWIELNADFTEWNVESQMNDPQSILNYYREIIRLKQEEDLFIYGTCTYIDVKDADIYVYKREWENEKAIVICNTSANEKTMPVLTDTTFDVILTNDDECAQTIGNTLSAYSCVVLRQKTFQ
ncbi:MAG: glycoside hydrolase family 13 protein [Culicoidibacterales bacterium]